MTPQDATYRADPAIGEIADFIGDHVAAAQFPQTILRFRNDRAAAEVGLAGLSDDAWISHFGRFAPLDGNLPQPLALRYHGHQFRHYNPDIGDGRGFLFAQLRDRDGRLLDLGTKGSGQTPYSRFGDGRLTLKGGVREILATEMLDALGVNTSKTFSIIETGEALHRGDELSPTRGAVMLRLSHGHIRIGSFQRLATLDETEALRRLARYALAVYYGESDTDDPAARLFEHVVARTADLAASYMVAGFVHGVLNTDNINISGESFDYGPWRFTPKFDGRFTAAYFDEQGLYAFGRQAEAIHWNLVQLARALVTVSDQAQLITSLDAFAPAYQRAIVRRMLARLMVQSRSESEDVALVQSIEQALTRGDVEIDRFFFDWAGGRLRSASAATAYEAAPFQQFAALVSHYAPFGPLADAYWQGLAPCSMHIDEVEAIWSHIANADDWQPLYAKVDAIRAMGLALLQR